MSRSFKNIGYERNIGTHGKGETNENGQLFIDACAENNLVIEGSIFQHRNNDKATWVFPGRCTENQMNNICISTKFRRSLLDKGKERCRCCFRPLPCNQRTT